MPHYWVEMRPAWWRQTLRAAETALAVNESMHPFEKDVHDITDDECRRVVERVSDLLDGHDGKWLSLLMSGGEMDVLWQGFAEEAFRARDEMPSNWRTATKWRKSSVPPEQRWAERSLRVAAGP